VITHRRGPHLLAQHTCGGLENHVHSDKVNILTLEAFAALANRGER
jgi:hypothetical protein